MSSTIPLGLLPTDDRIWQNSASTRGFKARLTLVIRIGSNAALIAVQVVGVNFWSRASAEIPWIGFSDRKLTLLTNKRLSTQRLNKQPANKQQRQHQNR